MPRRPPIPIEEVADLDLTAFVEQVAKAVAVAQKNLDDHSVRMLETLAKTEVVFPVNRTIIKQKKDSDGNVIGREAETRTDYLKTTLLGLGVQPTYYQFSKTLIEVAMDISVHKERRQTTTSEKKTFLRVSTKRLRQERRFNQDIKAHSKMTLEMVPVPPPVLFPETNRVEIVDE